MLRSSAIALLAAVAGPALADITPGQVWENWRAALDEDEAEVSTGSVDESDGAVVVRDLAITIATAEGEGYAISVDEIALTSDGKGGVDVRMSPEYPIELSDTDAEGTTRETRLRVRHPDLEMNVVEEAGTIRHVLSAPEVTLVIEEVLADGDPIGVTGRIVFDDLAARYDTGDGASASSSLTSSRITTQIDGADPDGSGTFDLDLSLSDVASDDLLQVMGTDMSALAANLEDGASRAASLASAATEFRITSTSDGESSTIEATTGASTTDITVLPDALRYAGRNQDAVISLSGTALPLPEASIRAARIATEVLLPLLADGTAQPYDLDVRMQEVRVDDGVWNMIDPAAVIPRDPGEVILDASGRMVARNGSDAGDAPVGRLETLVLEQVRVALAETELEATGRLAFPRGKEDTEALRPVGLINVTLMGAEGLLQRLSRAGLLPSDQAMGIQLMLNMFGQTGPGEDELTFETRFSEDGQVFLNGQPMGELPVQ